MRTYRYYWQTLKFYKDSYMPGFSWRHVLCLTEPYVARGVPRWIGMNCLALLAVVLLLVLCSGCDVIQVEVREVPTLQAIETVRLPNLVTVPVQERTSCTVTARALNMRCGPGTGWNVIGWLMEGQAVQVVDEIEAWALVQVDGSAEMGWVHASYLECEP